MSKKHRIAVLDPGHFHAALPLRVPNEKISDDVYVYSAPGKELDQFVSMIDSFNTRKENPCSWNLNVCTAENSLEKLISDGFCDIAVLAGRNASKMEKIAKLVKAGINVFADKPWITAASSLKLLESIMNEKALFADIMTERYDVPEKVLESLIAQEDIFGAFDTSRGAALSCGSVHHLWKKVNGKQLIRPDWYFDVAEQGEGIIDVTSHYADLAMRIFGRIPGFSLDSVKLDSATKWTTLVPLADFKEITGKDKFPDSVKQDLCGDVLNLRSNGEIVFSSGNLKAALRVEWRLKAAEGQGDSHFMRCNGSLSDISLGDAPGTIKIIPRASIKDSLEKWNQENPDIKLEEQEKSVLAIIPPEKISGHELHFAAVLNSFLESIETGKSVKSERELLFAKYKLMASAITK